MSSIKLFAQRISLVWVTNFLIALSGIFVLPIVTKQLNLADYGGWNLVLLTLSIVSIVSTLSLNTALYRFFPSSSQDDKRDIIYSIALLSFALSLLGALAVLVLYLLGIGRSFITSESVLALMLAAIPVYCLFTIIPAYFIVMKQIRIYSLIFLAQSYGELLLFAYMVRYGVPGLLASILCVRSLMLFVMFYFIYRDLGFKVPTFRGFSTLFNYNLPLFSTKITSWVVESSDRYIIDYFFMAAAVGLYSPGYNLGIMIYMLASPIEAVLTSSMSELFDQGKLDEVRMYLEYSLKFILVLIIPAFFGLSLLSKPILALLTTAEIASVSYQITIFTALSGVMLSLCVIFSQILILHKETRAIGFAWMLAAVFNFGLNLALVPIFGIIGAAATTLMAYFIIASYISLRAYKLFKFRIDWAFILKCLLASVAMALLLILVNPQKLLGLLVCIPAGALTYFVILYLIKGINNEETKFLKDMLHI